MSSCVRFPHRDIKIPIYQRKFIFISLTIFLFSTHCSALTDTHRDRVEDIFQLGIVAARVSMGRDRCMEILLEYLMKREDLTVTSQDKVIYVMTNEYSGRKYNIFRLGKEHQERVTFKVEPRYISNNLTIIRIWIHKIEERKDKYDSWETTQRWSGTEDRTRQFSKNLNRFFLNLNGGS